MDWNEEFASEFEELRKKYGDEELFSHAHYFLMQFIWDGLNHNEQACRFFVNSMTDYFFKSKNKGNKKDLNEKI